MSNRVNRPEDWSEAHKPPGASPKDRGNSADLAAAGESVVRDTSEDWNDAPGELLGLFAAYREACPEITGGPDFLPGIWRKIEGRQSFWFSFEHLARGWAAVAFALCLLLLALNLTSTAPPSSLSYADDLAAEHSADRTYYAEGVRTTPTDDTVESPYR